MVILESLDGRVHHDNKRQIWCQTFLDKENKEVIIRDMDGGEYNRYAFDEWGERGPDNMDLYDRYSAVSSRVVGDPAGFLEEEVFKPDRPDPRGPDLMYASLVTGEDVSFLWNNFDHLNKDFYSDRVPNPN